ncbi:MAG: lipopolysaccharide biosynthesis protein [Bacteroidota bacterium]|nr:lipopolysaccharide biosynthesis protein [Bacteroidota bacterium]
MSPASNGGAEGLRGSTQASRDAAFSERGGEFVRGKGMSLGRQSLWHFTAQVANGVLGIAVLSVLTRGLSVSDVGSYAFVFAVLAFLGMFADAGVSASGARIMAIADGEEEQRRRAAVLLTASLATGIILACMTAVTSFVVGPLFGSGTGAVLLAIAPLAAILPLQEMILALGQGANRIGVLSAFVIAPRMLALPLLVLMAKGQSLSLWSACAVTLGTTWAAVLAAAVLFRPMFRALGAEWPRLRTEVREFGREMYAVRVIDGLTTGLDKMLLSYFHGMVPVGYYTIAYTMATPIVLLSRSLSTSAYRRFAHEPSIPRKLLTANVLWCTIGTAVLIAACIVLVPLLFTDKYVPSLGVMPLLAIGAALMALNTPFHGFLAAQRQGRTLKRLSLATSGFFIAGNVALIPFFGMTGAALAFIGTFALNLFLNVRVYGAFKVSCIQGAAEV